MRLAHKQVLRFAALFLALAVMGGAGVWGLVRLQHRLDEAHADHEQLRTVYEVGNAAQIARLLAMHGVDAQVVEAQLNRAVTAAKPLQSAASSIEPAARDMAAHLRQAVQWNSAATPTLAVAHLNDALSDVATVASRLSNRIVDNRQATARQLTQTRAIVALAFAAAMFVAVVTSVQHYRGVMGPLRRIENGVTAMAQANFSQRLHATGDLEFRRLIQHFNNMADRLHELYANLEQQVRTKTRQLLRSEQLAAVGTLAAGVAHEINNPLGIIAGYAESSLRRIEQSPAAATDEKTIKALRIINEEAFRCKEITMRLLALATPGRAGERRMLNLGEIAQRTVTLLSDLPPYRDRTISVTIGDAPVRVRASASELTQVLLNVVRNALDATSPRDGRVEIAVEASGPWASVRVTDNGRGMNETVLSRLFEPFYTDGPRGPDAGAGLGLAVSHAIIEQHGGRINASSEGIDRGSTITLELPLASNAEVDAATSQGAMN